MAVQLLYSTMDAHGGWVASVIDLLRFVTAIDGRLPHTNLLSLASIATMTSRPSPPWRPAEEPYYGMGWQVRNTPGNWWHDGSLPGIRTEMVRAGNGFTWALLFNSRPFRTPPSMRKWINWVGKLWARFPPGRPMTCLIPFCLPIV